MSALWNREMSTTEGVLILTQSYWKLHLGLSSLSIINRLSMLHLCLQSKVKLNNCSQSKDKHFS